METELEMDVLSVSSSGVHMRKPQRKFEEIVDEISKELIYKIYIEDNNSIVKSCKLLNICPNTFQKLCNIYNIKKSKELIISSQSKSSSELQSKKSFDFLDKINREDFIDFYSNHSDQQTQIRYNIGQKKLISIINYYQIQRHTKSENTKLTCLEKYGSLNPAGNSEVRKKIADTCISRYGVDNPSKADTVKQKTHDTNMQRYGGTGWGSYEGMNKFKSSMNQKYGVDYACLLPQCFNMSHGSNSVPNGIFSNLLSDNDIDYEKEFIIDNFRYDFKVGNNLVEINPTYTHNSTIGFKGNPPLQKDYHSLKSKCAQKNGYRCIHVWDWDNKDAIISLLKPRQTVYARKCFIKEVDSNVAREYLNTYHLQGYAKDKVRIGLYYNNDLVSIMTFGKPRYNSKYEWELIRYCSSYNVIGGAEKLFSYFTANYKPLSIISYCDYSKFNGDTYLKLGFSFKSMSIGKHWYNNRTKKHVTDNLLRQRGFDQLFDTDFGKGSSNEQLMIDNGFVAIYDAGQATYIMEMYKHSKGIL